MTKRIIIYKRDKSGIICELVMPILLMLGGLILLQMPYLSDSPPKPFDSNGYPGPQRLLFNRDVVWHEGFKEEE